MATLVALGAACSDSDDGSAPVLDDPGATANDLLVKYVTLVQEKDISGREDFLSDAFIIQRADGSHRQKGDYLTGLPEIGEYSISEVVALQQADVLVVRWFVSIDQVVNGIRFSGDAAPRLSTFAFEDGEWRLISHANFNVPEE